MADLRALTADDDNMDLPADTELVGAYLVAGDAADATAALYDALAVSGGTVKASFKAVQKTQTPFIPLCGVKWRTGISIDITGANAVLYIIVK